MSHKQHFTHELHDEPDTWHRHQTAVEGLPQPEHGAHTNGLILAIAFIGSLGFVILTVVATVLYFQVHMTELRRQRIESTGFADAFFGKGGTQEQALAQLAQYSFATEAEARAGKASVPIDQAMQRVVDRYAGKN